MNTLDASQQALDDVFANESLFTAPYLLVPDIDGRDSLFHTLLALQLDSVFVVDRGLGAWATYITCLTQAKSVEPCPLKK